MKIVIIEDEKPTARDLARTIQAVEPDAQILPFINSLEEARLFFGQNIGVDLIFSDIELGDGLSFEVFEQFDIQIPIIYCTAYEAYTLKAFKSFGIDYIVKPFKKAHVAQALGKYKGLARRFKAAETPHAGLRHALANHGGPTPQSILVYLGDKIIPIAIGQVSAFYIAHEQVYAQVGKDKKYPIPDSLEVLEKRFPQFFRANRQYLLSRGAVKDASHYFNRKLAVNLHAGLGEPVVVSRQKAGAFLAWLSSNPHS